VRRRAAIALFAGTLLGLVAAATGQSSATYGPQSIDATNRGGPWLSPVAQGLSYSHELSSGHINFRLAPWGVIKSARGPAIPFALVESTGLGLDIEGLYPNYQGGWTTNGPPSLNANPSGSMWVESTPTISMSWTDFTDQYGDECDHAGPYVFTDFDGVAHDLGLGITEYSDPGGPCYGSGSTASQATDAPGLYATIASGMSWPYFVTNSSGTRYYFDWSSGSGLLTKIEDANGNYVTVTGVTGAGPEIWTDAAGKIVLEIYRQQYGGASGPYLPAIIDVFDS